MVHTHRPICKHAMLLNCTWVNNVTRRKVFDSHIISWIMEDDQKCDTYTLWPEVIFRYSEYSHCPQHLKISQYQFTECCSEDRILKTRKYSYCGWQRMLRLFTPVFFVKRLYIIKKTHFCGPFITKGKWSCIIIWAVSCNNAHE